MFAHERRGRVQSGICSTRYVEHLAPLVPDSRSEYRGYSSAVLRPKSYSTRLSWPVRAWKNVLSVTHAPRSQNGSVRPAYSGSGSPMDVLWTGMNLVAPTWNCTTRHDDILLPLALEDAFISEEQDLIFEFVMACIHRFILCINQ
jgi:hypothetical protein